MKHLTKLILQFFIKFFSSNVTSRTIQWSTILSLSAIYLEIKIFVNTYENKHDVNLYFQAEFEVLSYILYHGTPSWDILLGIISTPTPYKVTNILSTHGAVQS